EGEETFGRVGCDEADQIELDRRLAHIHLSQGQLHILRREFDQAETMLENAGEMLVKLRAREPDDSILRRDLAEVYHSLGELFLNRDTDGAARHEALLKSQSNFEESKDLRERLKDDSKGAERRNHQRDLARSLGYLGDLYLAQGDVVQAARDYDLSKDLR